MPTVSKEIAEEQIAHCKKLKRPKMFCIVKYWNVLSNKEDWSLCYRERHYQGLFESPAIANVAVLWANPRSGLKEGPTRADSGDLTDQELREEMVGDDWPDKDTVGVDPFGVDPPARPVRPAPRQRPRRRKRARAS